MKMGKAHDVPLSNQALAILRDLTETRGQNPHVFPGRPMRSLSNMALAMLLRRLGIDATVHGMRASARTWMADQGVPFEIAEACSRTYCRLSGGAGLPAKLDARTQAARAPEVGRFRLPRLKRGAIASGGMIRVAITQEFFDAWER